MTAPPTSEGPAVVTGGSGFIGAHLVHALVGSGRSVHVLGRARTDRWRLTDLAGSIEHHGVDLSSIEGRRQIVPLMRAIAPSEVFHLAAAPMVAGSGADVASTIAVNVFGAHAVLEGAVAAGGCSIVTVGDAFEYDDRGRPLRESDAEGPGPASIHGITRLAATRAASRVGLMTGTPISTVRVFSVHGPHDHPRRLVPHLVDAARHQTPIPLSDRSVVRDWLHVDDVVDALRRAARLPADDRAAGRVFNVGSGIATTIEELVDLVADLVGERIDARWGAFPPTEHDGGYWVADLSHTVATLGWEPSGSVRDGLLRTIAATP